MVSSCGPLFGDGFDPARLDYDYWNTEIQTKLADFKRITKADYLELLRQNSFVMEFLDSRFRGNDKKIRPSIL